MKKLASTILVLWSALVCAAFAPLYVPAVNMVSGADGPIGPPEFIANGSFSTSTPGMPAGWQVGDLLILTATAMSLNSTPPVFNSVSGYTALANCRTQTYSDEFSTLTNSLYVFYRIAQSGDSAPSISVSSGDIGSGVLTAYRNINSASPFEATAAANNLSPSASLPYGTITTLGPSRVVGQFFANMFATSTTPSAGWTEIFESSFSSFGSILLNTLVVSSAGVSPSGNASGGSTTYACRVTTAIKPNGS